MLIPAAALVVVVVFPAWPKQERQETKSSPPQVQSQGQLDTTKQANDATTKPQTVTANQPQSIAPSMPSQPPTQKKAANHKNKVKKVAVTPKVMPEEQPVNSIIENSGQIQGLEISGGEVGAPANGRGTILRNLGSGKVLGDTKIENSHVDRAPSTPKLGHPFVEMERATNVLIDDYEVCGSSSAVASQGSNAGALLKGIQVNSKSCNWHFSSSNLREPIGTTSPTS